MVGDLAWKIPVWSLMSEKESPPMSRCLCTQPHSVTSSPTHPSEMSPHSLLLPGHDRLASPLPVCFPPALVVPWSMLTVSIAAVWAAEGTCSHLLPKQPANTAASMRVSSDVCLPQIGSPGLRALLCCWNRSLLQKCLLYQNSLSAAVQLEHYY